MTCLHPQNHEIERTGARRLVDATLAVTTVHFPHAYMHAGAAGSDPTKVWSASSVSSSWEVYLNSALSVAHGNFTRGLGTGIHASGVLRRCDEPSLGNLCLLERLRLGACNCELSSAVLHSSWDIDARVGHVSEGHTTMVCGRPVGAVRNASAYPISGVAQLGAVVGLPHTLEQLLPRVADASKTVVLTGLMGNYLPMLLSFVCQLRNLGLTNLLVAAFDEDAYRGAFLHRFVCCEAVKLGLIACPPRRSLPVFLVPAPAGLGTDCAYGTDCFRAVTKTKSRTTLQVRSCRGERL